MARKRAPMHKIREIIRLSTKGLSQRQIARTTRLSRPVVAEYLRKFKELGLCAEEFCALPDDSVLDLWEKGKDGSGGKLPRLKDRFPDMSAELKRTGVNLQVLWKEYLEVEGNGYSYSQFCHHYSQFKEDEKLWMHQEHKAGDKVFVDFTGKKIPYVNRVTGEVREAEVFVSVLGASLYTFVEAKESQQSDNWLSANENMFRYYGGVPEAIVPDNLKPAVNKPSRYEPELNRQYERFAEHYGTVIFPARVRKPKDKSLVENAVNIVYSRIFAPLRNRIFSSIAEINEAVRPLLEEYNAVKMRSYGASRRELFDKLDAPALKPLPAEKYEQRQLEVRKVQFNYHVFLKSDNHYYSVPFRFRGKEVDIWYSYSAVEIIHKNTRIALHSRLRNAPNKYSTVQEHMPAKHSELLKWNPERFISWASDIGKNVETVISTILEKAAYPEQAYKVCMGILNLSKKFENGRLNDACARAIRFNGYSFKFIQGVLLTGLDKDDKVSLFSEILPEHDNIRGVNYYAE